MLHKRDLGSKAFDVFNIIGMALINFIMLYPFIYVFSISISDSDIVGRGKVMLFPKGFDMLAYKTIFKTNDITQAYANTILYTVVGTAVLLLIVCLAAYPLSKEGFLGKNAISFALSITYILPTGMIASFLMIRNLHMLNTMWALVIPPAFNFWYIAIVRTGFKTIPSSLAESAKLDGAGEWRILFQIIMPLSKATLATVALFSSVAQWNGFFQALLYLDSPSKYPLQMILRKIVVAHDVNSMGFQDTLLGGGAMGRGFSEKIEMATILASIGPIILVYPFLQKYFVKGMLLGSVKG